MRFNGEDDRVLPHPGEADTLREWGLDWQKLERADRMGRRVLTVCDRCSALAHRDADDGMLPQRVSRLVDGLPVLSGVIGANAESASSSAWRRAARAG